VGDQVALLWPAVIGRQWPKLVWMSFHDVLGQETVDYIVEEISKSDARFFPLRQFGNATCRKCAETQRAEMQSAVTVLLSHHLVSGIINFLFHFVSLVLINLLRFHLLCRHHLSSVTPSHFHFKLKHIFSIHFPATDSLNHQSYWLNGFSRSFRRFIFSFIYY